MAARTYWVALKRRVLSPYNVGVFLSPFKLMVIAAVIMLLMGPDKLPEVAHKLGAAWRTLKNLQQRVESEVREALPDLPSTSDLARIARSPVNLLNQLADRVDAKEELLKNADVGREAPVATSEPSPAPPTPQLSRPTALSDGAPPSDPSLN